MRSPIPLAVAVVLIVLLGADLASRYLGAAADAAPTFVASAKPLSADEKLAQYSLLDTTKVLNLKKHYIVDFRELKEQLLALQKTVPFKSYIYVSYLNNSAWVGIDERDSFFAASQVKIPLAMATYKAIENGILTPETEYTLTPEDLNGDFGELYKKGPGTTIALKDLLHLMLSQSDNTAMEAIRSIFARVGVQDPMDDVYANLGWDFLPTIKSGTDPSQDQNYRKISVKVLANMFLALYSGAYLNLDHSQAILADLTKTPFDTQLDAGVPKDIPVAHKVGVATAYDTFSDCGIVYAPSRNYLVCVGVEGTDQAHADSYISAVSKTVYDYIISN